MLDGIKNDNPSLKIWYYDESFFRSETPLTHAWGDRTDRKVIKASGHQGTVGVIGAVEPISGNWQKGFRMNNFYWWETMSRIIKLRVLLNIHCQEMFH